jgi:hypothetical protein
MSDHEGSRRRSSFLLAAEHARAAATRDAELEYADTVLKLRERFERDLALAAARRLALVAPAHRAYNRAAASAELMV